MGQATEEVPATRKERKMQEGLERTGDGKSERLCAALCRTRSRWGGIRDAGRTLTLLIMCAWGGKGKGGIKNFF